MPSISSEVARSNDDAFYRATGNVGRDGYHCDGGRRSRQTITHIAKRKKSEGWDQMRLKEGVRVINMQPGLCLGLMMAESVYKDYGRLMTVTSLNDSNHSPTSLHYSGNAADLRTEVAGIDFETAEGMAAEIKERLGVDFDVVAESDHIHLEYQPRRPS